jgi:hypothetical protein
MVLVPDDTPSGGVYTRSRRKSRRRLFIVVGIVVVLLALLGAGGLRASTALAEYQAVSGQIDTLRSLADRDLGTLSVQDVADLKAQMAELGGHMRGLRDSLSIPVVDELLPHLPWVGPRYTSARNLDEIGVILSETGSSLAGVGEDVLAAFDSTGMSPKDSQAGPTWLDAVTAHQADLQPIAAQIDRATALRAEVQADVLPGGAKAALSSLDRVLGQLSSISDLISDPTSFQAALGGDQPARYLILIMNPAELRPSGGFPGTMGLVTLSHGQLESYDIFSESALNAAYAEKRSAPQPQPWPIQQYFPQDGLQLHDASWWADFPKSGATIMAMYQETGWPAIDGVITIDPQVVSGLLQVTGPLMVSLDSGPKEVTADSVYQEIESERVRKWNPETGVSQIHKEFLAIIGSALIDRLESSDRTSLLQAAKVLGDSALKRDIQMYSRNETVQATLAKQGWTGSLTPKPGVPTVAVNFANVVLAKGSLVVHPHLKLTDQGLQDGRRVMKLDVTVEHTGKYTDDPFYSGFQRWWVEVNLPQGSTITARSFDPKPDPEAPNGGSYVMDIYPEHSNTLSLTFTMPDQNTLLVRRQPGVYPVSLEVSSGENQPFLTTAIESDVTVELPR